MNFFGPRSLWETAPHFVDAISSVLTGAGASAAVGNVAGDVVEGAVAGGGLAALSGRNPLTGALVGGAGGAAVGAYNNWSGLTGSVSPADLLDSNGNPITPPTPPQLDPTTGKPIEALSIDPQTGQLVSGAASTGGTYDTAGNLVSGGGGVAGQAATTAGGGGGLTGGPPGGINNTSLALGALGAIGSVLNKPQVGKYATPGPNSTTQGAFYNTPLTSANAPGRTYTAPNLPTGAQPNYWQYGGPEQNYFTNNSLAAYGFAHGGATGQDEFTVAKDGHHVRGPGTGISDDVPAMLSNKEYVLTYDDLARLGNKFAPGRGDANERGAKWLDKFRHELAKDAGQPQFPPKRLGRGLNEPARGAL